MSEGGEPKQDSQKSAKVIYVLREENLNRIAKNLLRLPMSEGGEPKQDSQKSAKVTYAEGGEPKQDSQKSAKVTYV